MFHQPARLRKPHVAMHSNLKVEDFQEHPEISRYCSRIIHVKSSFIQFSSLSVISIPWFMATSTHSCQEKINYNIIHNDIVEKINFDMNVTTTPLTKKPGETQQVSHLKNGQRQLGKHASIFALRSQPLFRWTQPWSSTARTTIGYNWIKHGYSPEN